ncbi:ubiquitin-activating enzyme E1 1-like, partial [Trifolium medium]|nr:ubiquitin-activating enzyme E1 1-like [Trifolium medium]
MAEPVPPKVIKHQSTSWTVWDRWTLGNDPTVGELIQWLEDKGLKTYSISCGNALLFNIMLSSHRERMDRKIGDLGREVA